MITNQRNVFILGASGTLGQQVAKQLSTYNKKPYDGERWDFSLYGMTRDEQKLAVLKREGVFKKIFLGGLLTANLKEMLKGMDVVFHFAALKHVDLMEAFPTTCIETNVYGTQKVIESLDKDTR